MIEIDIRKITEINENKLLYHDDNGNVSFVDLELCAEFHEKETGRNPNFSYRSVGEREYPYYDLYSPEGIRLYLKTKKLNPLQRLISSTLGWSFNSKEFDLWYSIQKSLNENGWTTLDLS